MVAILEPKFAEFTAAIHSAWGDKTELAEHPGLEKCIELSEQVATAEKIATDAIVLGRHLAGLVEADAIECATEVGDTLYPQFLAGHQWFDNLGNELVEGQAHLCNGGLCCRFEEARKQFDRVYAYINQWPRTNSQYRAAVRTAIAKGDIEFSVDSEGTIKRP